MYTAIRAILVVCLVGFQVAPAAANGWSNVAINGVRLTAAQLRSLEASIGSRVAPGAYLTNAQGCWMNLNTGATGCLGKGGDTHSRYGSGSRNQAGDWNHWSNAAGAGVGGTSDGCIYTTMGWSNC